MRFETLACSSLFSDHTFLDVGRAIDDFNTLRLASPEKVNRIKVHKRYLVEVQSDF